VASYRAAVEALNAFLADPRRLELETSFTYKAGVVKTLRGVGTFAGGLFVLGMLVLLFPTYVSTFERGRVVLASRSLLRRSRYEATADEIAAVVERQGPRARALGLELRDGSTVVVVHAPCGAPEPLAARLAEVLAKPLREA
jgi:hypothetical protein